MSKVQTLNIFLSFDFFCCNLTNFLVENFARKFELGKLKDYVEAIKIPHIQFKHFVIDFYYSRAFNSRQTRRESLI